MKFLLLTISLMTLLSASEPVVNPYNTTFCNTEEEKIWNGIIKNDPYNMNIQELHATWLGLCIKVEKHELTTNQADSIFQKAREKVMEQEILKTNQQSSREL